MNVSNRSDQYVIYLKLFSFLVLQKDNTLPESLGKISWNLFDIKPASSHSLCQTSETEKGTRPAVGSVLRASFAALPAASFPRIPICPGTHIKIVSFLSALILCKGFCICISRGWSVLNFFKLLQSRERVWENHEYLFFWLVYLF